MRRERDGRIDLGRAVREVERGRVALVVGAVELAEIGRGFYAVTTLILLGLVGLAAPAAAAGAICLDKDRGNLALLFATDLTDAGLGLIKRQILEKTNRAMGQPLLKEVLFSKFNFVER